MNSNKSGGRGPRRAGALAAVAAITLLTAACGVVHVHFGSAPAQPAQPPFRVELAYAQCMRTHGLPGFPDPSPSGGSSLSGHLNGSTAARANNACKHILTGGS